MKLALFVCGLAFLSSQAFAAEPSDTLVKALISVESHGNDSALGDTHLRNKAYGCLQIRKPVCDDVNRRCGTHYRAEDCLGNRELSVKICRIYIDMYATASRLGHAPTDEDKARIWNGGPHGWRKATTQAYWERVREELK